MQIQGDDIFAEIDIEPMPSRAMPKDEVLRSKVMHPAWAQALSVLSEPIAPRAPDPIRERFYKMRRLSAERPFPKSDSELFYRQAKFMEDFTDDYDGDAKFNMYFPCYQQMGYDYLRTYFTWRTRVRSGEIQPTSLSYIFLYIYELLSGVGVDSPESGLDALMKIWNTFSAQYPVINNYLTKWLKDYHIFYELPHTFPEFVENHNLQKYYSLTLLFEKPGTQEGGQLAMWNTVSGYDITKSRFYKEDGNGEMLSKCFDAVLAAIGDYCLERGANFEDMLVYSVSRRAPWRPFKNALFDSRVRQTDREVHISKYERYYCKNGQWTANLPIYYSTQKDFVGYIIKKTEACLRDCAGYKYKLVAEMKPGAKPFRELQRPALKRAELDRVIDKAVRAFYGELSRIVVEVDHRSLNRIREQAQETQEQLIVEEEQDTVIAASEQSDTVIASNVSTPQTLSLEDGWKELAKTLTNAEKQAISLALSTPTDLKAFAAGQNIMLEVLVDGINEKASDCIGDSIMELAGGESDIYIFDEYISNLKDFSVLSPEAEHGRGASAP